MKEGTLCPNELFLLLGLCLGMCCLSDQVITEYTVTSEALRDDSQRLMLIVHELNRGTNPLCPLVDSLTATVEDVNQIRMQLAVDVETSITPRTSGKI